MAYFFFAVTLARGAAEGESVSWPQAETPTLCLLRVLCDVLFHFCNKVVVIHAGIHQFGERVSRHLRSIQEALVRASRIYVGAEPTCRPGTRRV